MKNNPLPEILRNVPVLPVLLDYKQLDLYRSIMYKFTGTKNITNAGVIALLELLYDAKLIMLKDVTVSDFHGKITLINRIVDGE